MDDSAGRPRFAGAQLIVGTNDKVATYDARYLISTLLVFVAKSDGSISDVESNTMIASLTSRMHLQNSEALHHISSAIMALSNDKDILETLRKISQGMSADERSEIFTMMLEVMAADESRQPDEIRAVNLAGQILGLSQDAIHAQLRSFSSKS